MLQPTDTKSCVVHFFMLHFCIEENYQKPACTGECTLLYCIYQFKVNLLFLSISYPNGMLEYRNHIGISPEIHRMINLIGKGRDVKEYEDGLQFIYFYTKGQKGGSQAIKNMLTYFQNSDSKNAVDDATKMIDRYVRKVKSLPEVEAGYIIDNKEKVAANIREKYPDYAENADELVEKYW